ncbi:MAG TPA: D-alanine--D-alanine ligase [Candidatus Acidoferrales bacterium]|nr:D-alanine--D-alanine ligase [Candidatus Acidoferrales bacterium]
MPRKQNRSIAVVCGGPSAEAEVSRVTARGVAQALRDSYENVTTVELDERISESLKELKTEVVFPALHGPPGEDGTFQGFLEILGIPYVGSGVEASACAMDKVVAKQIFRAFGLPVARDLIVHRSARRAETARHIAQALGSDVVVKPSCQGSAVGVSFARNDREIDEALERAFVYDERLLIEERISGREITVAILERNGIEALPVIEIRTPSGTWYDYEHRYTPGLSEHIVPAPLPAAQYARTQEVAKLAFQCLNCRDLARVDFVVPEEGEPIVLEVNTLPGMTPTSLYPDAARAGGLSFEELVAYLVERAWARGQKRKAQSR